MQFRTLFTISLLALIAITSAGCKTSKSPAGSRRHWHWDDDLARRLDRSTKRWIKKSEAENVRSQQKERFNDRLNDLDYNF
ncbi:MAG: hypothetical protein ACTHK7_02885 [Aureliella sp.]